MKKTRSWVALVAAMAMLCQIESCQKSIDNPQVLDTLTSMQRQNDSLLLLVLKMQVSLDSIQSQVKSGNGMLQSLSGNITALQTSIAGLMGNINSLNQKLDTTNLRLGVLQTQLSNVTTQYTNLSTQINSVFGVISVKIDSLGKQVGNNTNVLNTLQQQYYTTQIKVDSILLYIQGINQQLTVTNTDLVTIQQQLILITSQYNTILTLLNQLIAQLVGPKAYTAVTVLYLGGADSLVVSTNTWHYLAMTKDGLTGTVYIDGQMVYSSSFVNQPYIWNSLLLGATQGCLACSPVANYDGLIDEVRLSSVVRTPSEILNTYTQNVPFGSDANTIGLFHFDTQNGNSLVNSAGANGALMGAPTYVLGKFGNAISLNGTSDYGLYNVSIPVDNMSVEFWFNSSTSSGTMAMMAYAYNTGISLRQVIH